MTQFKTLFLLFCFFGTTTLGFSQEIREYMDLQTHPTMHLAYGFFSKGLQFFDPEKPPKLSHKHIFTNVNYANYLKDNKGSRIIVHGAIAPELSNDREKAILVILEQLKFVNDFADRNAEDFVVATSPEEVREYVHTTDKTIIIHSIEGAKGLIHSQGDANFWADQGISFFTLVHLMDDEYGGGAILPYMNTKLINLKGTLHKKRRRGLTEKGKQAILWLAEAGIMTDLTHMSDSTREDALTFMAEHNIPPLVTHDVYKPIQNHPRGITEKDYLRIYQQNGLASLPISGASLIAHEPRADYARKLAELDSLDCFCSGSIDSYKFTYLALQQLIEGNIPAISGNTYLEYADLSEAQKVQYAIGFQSDFNGWLDHSRPRFGKKGCWDIDPDANYEAIEIEGMPHPGLMNSHWRWMEKEGVDIAPVRRASERFLQIWEYLRDDWE